MSLDRVLKWVVEFLIQFLNFVSYLLIAFSCILNLNKDDVLPVKDLILNSQTIKKK